MMILNNYFSHNILFFGYKIKVVDKMNQNNEIFLGDSGKIVKRLAEYEMAITNVKKER